MNKYNGYLVFFFFLLSLSCSCQQKKEIIITDKSKRVENDSTLHFDIGMDTFQVTELKQWDKTESEKIKKINLYSFDSIPIEFQQFPNVEKIVLGYDWQNIYLPDIFPNLKIIELDMVRLSIDKNARFKKTLEEINGGKSTIKSIASFTELPNLKTIVLGFSDFDPFPTDLNKLQFLETFILGAYNSRLDISNLGLAQLKSLKKVVLHCNFDQIVGFPNDIAQINRQIELEIVNDKLTKEQKKILSEFKKSK
jgi:hypothetical protein